MTNNEVHIAPKLRNTASTTPRKLQSANSKYESALGPVSVPTDKASSPMLRVLPASVHNMEHGHLRG
ncbi:hypothetical protein FIBSPDRAFT_879252 [Athelia psychrophila]|uniref:Uncharacterized protein n=1 Tax=Athelia psychrophila TaxID=1759441 RepID=A0A167U7I4_9AGAM|nr:hypothetical protein FIBSPDRAFT_879252 [Fibularhizoctonia sp. CBS 109695]